MTSQTKKKAESSQELKGATANRFLGGRLTVFQPRAGHRAGDDAVFLAAAVPAEAGERVLEAGTGVGVAGLCLLARVAELSVTAVEIDPALCTLARANAEKNNLAKRFSVIEADITAPAKVLDAAGLEREGYDHVIANPPFFAEGTVRAASEPQRAVAHVMGRGDLVKWIRFLTTMAAPGARLSMIHRAENLGDILFLLQGRFGDIAVFPLFPKEGGAATRIIVQGRKGSRAGLRLLSGLVVHETRDAYSADAEAVLRDGAALRLAEPEKKKGRHSGG